MVMSYKQRSSKRWEGKIWLGWDSWLGQRSLYTWESHSLRRSNHSVFFDSDSLSMSMYDSNSLSMSTYDSNSLSISTSWQHTGGSCLTFPRCLNLTWRTCSFRAVSALGVVVGGADVYLMPPAPLSRKEWFTATEWLGIHTRVGSLVLQEELSLVTLVRWWQIWFVLVTCHGGIIICGILIPLRVVFRDRIHCWECRDWGASFHCSHWLDQDQKEKCYNTFDWSLSHIVPWVHTGHRSLRHDHIVITHVKSIPKLRSLCTLTLAFGFTCSLSSCSQQLPQWPRTQSNWLERGSMTSLEMG